MGTRGLCLRKRLEEEAGRPERSRKVGDGVQGLWRGSGRGAKGVVSLVLLFSSSPDVCDFTHLQPCIAFPFPMKNMNLFLNKLLGKKCFFIYLSNNT